MQKQASHVRTCIKRHVWYLILHTLLLHLLHPFSHLYIWDLICYMLFFIYQSLISRSYSIYLIYFHLIHMDPESCLSCIIIELRVLERHTSILFFIWDSLTRYAILQNRTLFVKFRILHETQQFLSIYYKISYSNLLH